MIAREGTDGQVKRVYFIHEHTAIVMHNTCIPTTVFQAIYIQIYIYIIQMNVQSYYTCTCI